MSLVADYGNSSASESESDSDSENSETTSETVEEYDDRKSVLKTEKLPGPAFGNASTSVFSNPFVEAEKVKKAILEKHVKMVPTKEDTRTINGKKICWNYRKGRCRFGHNCTFAHDSDIQKSQQELDEENKPQTFVISQKNDSLTQPFSNRNNNLVKNKKRPGLTQGLNPSKKVMKTFYKQQNKTNFQ